METTATKLSANALIEFIRLLNVDELELYVPMLIPDTKVEKNGWDMDVTVIDPWRFHTIRDLYSCSETARVVKYQGYTS